jgi:hypothetical protein
MFLKNYTLLVLHIQFSKNLLDQNIYNELHKRQIEAFFLSQRPSEPLSFITSYLIQRKKFCQFKCMCPTPEGDSKTSVDNFSVFGKWYILLIITTNEFVSVVKSRTTTGQV